MPPRRKPLPEAEAIKEKRGMGRPTKLTPELQALFVSNLKLGLFWETTCGLCGIEKGTASAWVKRGVRAKQEAEKTGQKVPAAERPFVDFSTAVQHAVAEFDKVAQATILKAGQSDWKAMLALLRIRHPGWFTADAQGIVIQTDERTTEDGDTEETTTVTVTGGRDELTEDDFALLASLPPGGAPSIVHCPSSHRYFEHTPFEFRRLHDLGVNLCTGTDSLASTRSLSLFEELRSLGKTDPWLTAEQLLRTVTVNPARALRRRGQLGQITPGALADLITVPVSGRLASVHEEIVQHELPIAWTMLDGQVLG